MPQPGQKQLNRLQLISQFRLAGVREGDILLVHSALSKVGWIVGGPREMIHALREAIGPRGTLVMPTFTFSMEGWNLPPFDAQRTPSRVGRLTEVFRLLTGVRRTNHPTHSVAAIGPKADCVLGDRINYEPLGIGSPLDRVRELGGKILLIGVGQNRNSTVHLAESRAGLAYLRVPFTEGAEHDTALFYTSDKKTPERLVINETPGSSEGFNILDGLLADRGVTKPFLLGNARSTMMHSRELCDAVEDLLRETPTLLLQSPDASEISLKRRRYMEQILARKPIQI